jgi:hypothetical protein
MSLRVLVDVSLRGPEVAVTGQHLDVPQRAPDRRDLPRRVGDEGSPADPEEAQIFSRPDAFTMRPQCSVWVLTRSVNPSGVLVSVSRPMSEDPGQPL